MLASRRLAALLVSIPVVAAGCSGTGTSSSAPPAPPVAASSTSPAPASTATMPPTAAPTVAPTPTSTPTPFAITDGEPWIVYQWLQDCGNDSCDDGVYLVRPDGRDRHLLLTTPAGHPDWSPDGKRIAVDEPPVGPGEIWTLNADGTGHKKLIACSGAPCTSLGFPAWSPDGKHLAFLRNLKPNAPGYEDSQAAIEVLDVATGATRVVAMSPIAVTESVQYMDPRWSPDGTLIVFTVMRYPMPPTDENILGSSIAIVKADGSQADEPRILTDPAMFANYPNWSPDGQRIVFSTNPLGSFQETTKVTNLYTIRPDGTGRTQVTHFGENDTRASQPTWTPDGKQIIFTQISRNPSNTWGERQVALIDADGSNLTLIPVPGTADDHWYGTHARMRPTP